MKATKFINVWLGVLLATCLTLFGQTAYAAIAGHTQFVNGAAQITNSVGQTRTLQKGDVIHESDTVTTSKNATVQIKMLDGGLIAIRPDSKLKFDSFVFSGVEDGNEQSFFSLLRGGFRAITGMIGKTNKKNYRITTAAATIGVRGTDHETFLVVPGSELAAIAPTGVYNKVNVGETVMTTDKGAINILPNQMGFAAALDQMPLLQPVNLNIFTAVPAANLNGSGGQTGGSGRASAVVDNVVQDPILDTSGPATGGTALQPIDVDRGPIAPPVQLNR